MFQRISLNRRFAGPGAIYFFIGSKVSRCLMGAWAGGSKLTINLVSLAIIAVAFSNGAYAFDLDWSGTFRAEGHYLRNYNLDSSSFDPKVAGSIDPALPDPARLNKGGYYIPGGGEHSSSFEIFNAKLRPKLIVNDNISIKSEWWVGDPVFGFFGNAFPHSADQRQYYSTSTRGSSFTAARLWGEFLTDFGNLQVGRAPLHWGLGAVWNQGDGIWDRYSSTGDLVRLNAKFGAFTLSPGFVKYSMGNTLGGSCALAGASCITTPGSGSMHDITLQLKYENLEDDLEGGVNYIKRTIGNNQDPLSGALTFGTSADPSQHVGGAEYTTWDIYAKKKIGPVEIGGEVPIVSGDMGVISEFKTFAVVTEAKWKITDAWETNAKFGHAPGQPNVPFGVTPDRYKAFYFNPGYKVGMILFNYQLANLSGINTDNSPYADAQLLKSPFDNTIVNANYWTLGGSFRTDKWKFRTNWVFAQALETAAVGSDFYNHQLHKYFKNTAATKQSSFLGWEMDYGVDFQWDDSLLFGFDTGFYFPGAFYQFSNTAVQNKTDFLFAGAVKVGLNF